MHLFRRWADDIFVTMCIRSYRSSAALAYLFLIAVSFLLPGCKDAPSGKEYYSKEFNWRIVIPEGVEPMTPEAYRKLQGDGQGAIEETVGTEIVNEAKPVFIFKQGADNLFESNYQPFDTTVDGDYLTTCRQVNALLFETFRSQMGVAQIDSSSATEDVDGLTFQKFSVVIRKDNRVMMNSRLYSRLFGKKEFSVNIVYADDAFGKKMIRAWEQSVFH